MKLNIVTRNFDLPEGFDEVINKKYERLQHFSNRIMSGEMIGECNGSDYHLEFLLKLRGGQIAVHSHHHELRKGINSLFDKLKRRLRKEEDLIKDHRTKGKYEG